MLYVTPLFVGPSGKERASTVVEVADDGRLLSFYPFKNEFYSLVFVEEIFVTASSQLKHIDDAHDDNLTGSVMYAYSVNSSGELRLLA